MVLRPLRARTQPRITRQRLQKNAGVGVAVAEGDVRLRSDRKSVACGEWFYDRYAPGRSLALLVSDYRKPLRWVRRSMAFWVKGAYVCAPGNILLTQRAM